MPEFSVLVLTYNPSLADLELTLRSVICQQDVTFELVVADDGSECDVSGMVKRILAQHGFENYQLVTKKQNKGTVENILDGLHVCRGKYVKPIGTGDLLYDATVLRRMFDCMDSKNFKQAFGKMCAFTKEGNTFQQRKLWSPRGLGPYHKGAKKVLRYDLLHRNWVAGALLFYDTRTLATYLERFRGKVLFAEDLIQIPMLLDGLPMGYLAQYVMLYEASAGVTGDNTRMRRDECAFFEILSKEYGEHEIVEKAKRLDTWLYKGPKALQRLKFFVYQGITNPYYFGVKIRTRLPWKREEQDAYKRSLLIEWGKGLT